MRDIWFRSLLADSRALSALGAVNAGLHVDELGEGRQDGDKQQEHLSVKFHLGSIVRRSYLQFQPSPV
jgi:hypothetical protein